MTSETDIQNLVEEFKKGNESAFNEIFNAFKRPIYFMAMRLVANHSDADEIVQKTFMQTYIHLKNFRGESSFKTWVYRIAINACKDHLKSKDHRVFKINLDAPSMRKLSTAQESPIKKFIQEDRKKILMDKINQLSNQQKTTVVLRIFEDMAFKEIAEVLACKESTAKVHYHQALIKLKGSFKDHKKGDLL